ncbi:membrane protein insertase YidC [Thermodesulfobacterium hydrogeniphilum]|uniref:membrane protein insertase YidC n=1 Tax=Thermodesulfobacterium hydrogeniphilum TaxID=161156 RepID=UPI0006900AD1|nr:membrane protein insertase YidC [Thermodesulfobacterium hydrogeniphilum]
MEKRVILALALSFLVILGFQFLYTKFFPSPKIFYNATSKESFKYKSKEISEKVQKKRIESDFFASNLKNFLIYLIDTPEYNATLISSGVRFQSFKLKKYFIDKKKKKPVELVSASSESLPLEIYLSSKPELAVIGYKGPETKKIVVKNTNNKTVSFITNYQNIVLEKTFTFKKNSYYIDMKVTLINKSKKNLKDNLLIRGVFSPFVDGTRYVFKGPFYYTDHLNEVKIKNHLEEFVGPLKYIGFEDNYFMVAVIPENMSNSTFRATFRNLKKNTQEFILWLPTFELKTGGKISYKFKLYMGPKKLEEMQKEYPLLGKALYFGIFDFVAKPLLYILKFSNKFTHNFGWDIIIITILLRILFFPLNHISFKSMKKMQELQPIIQRLREKYKDDPQALNQEIMKIYKTYKINPFSGCLPIFIQIPVFIAFYKVLLMAIELRHAPFMLWIDDLSAPERLYLGNFHIPYLGGIPLLTILMGFSMYLQQKLSPSSPDPFQQKLMLFMPVFFTILFVNFPSGLVLYWFVNNILSIAQQYLTLKLSKK